MKPQRKFLIALVTAPDMKTARSLSKAVLKARLAACANLIPKAESHYWWRGRIEKASEVMILLKTTPVHCRDLEKLVLARHPYDTPEFVVLPVTGGNKRYLDWWQTSTSRKEKERRRGTSY